MINYVYENGFTIGYMHGEALIRFARPIAGYLS